MLWEGGNNSRIAEIFLNRATVLAIAEAWVGTGVALSAVNIPNTGPFLFTAEQYLEVRVYQNISSTGNLNVTTTSLASPAFWAFRIE